MYYYKVVEKKNPWKAEAAENFQTQALGMSENMRGEL